MKELIESSAMPEDAQAVQAVLALHRENKGEIDARANEVRALTSAASDKPYFSAELAAALGALLEQAVETQTLWDMRHTEYLQCSVFFDFTSRAEYVSLLLS